MAKFELTEREKVIAAGGDPDEVVNTTTEETVEEAAEQEAEQTVETQTETEPETKEPEQEEIKSWVDDDVRELAASYNLDEDDLKSFTSVDEFNRYARLHDKHLTRNEEKETTVQASEQVQSEDSLPDLDLKQFEEDGWEPKTLELVKHAKGLKDKVAVLEERYAQIEARERNAAYERSLYSFHDLVDTMDAERYGASVDDKGDPVELDKKYNENRAKLWDAADTIAAGIVQKAQRDGVEPKVPSMKVLLKRAEQFAFGEELRGQEIRKFQEKASAQSKKRRPAAGRSRVSAPAGGGEAGKDEDPVMSIVNDPKVVAKWNKLQEQAA